MVLFEKDIDGDTWLSQVPDSYYLWEAMKTMCLLVQMDPFLSYDHRQCVFTYNYTELV